MRATGGGAQRGHSLVSPDHGAKLTVEWNLQTFQTWLPWEKLGLLAGFTWCNRKVIVQVITAEEGSNGTLKSPLDHVVTD